MQTNTWAFSPPFHRLPYEAPAVQRGRSGQVTNYSSETHLCSIVTEGKEPEVWYPDDVEKSTKMNKTLSIPEVSDARLIRQKTIYYVVGFVVVSIALWKGWIPSLIWYI